MSLRRFFIASSLILSPLAAIGFESAAFADTSQQIPLEVTVPSRLSITAAPDANAAALQNVLDLSRAEPSPAKIADITVDTNEPNVSITATSANSGTLRNSANNVAITYRLAIVADESAISVSNSSTVSELNFQAANAQYDLHIVVDVPENVAAGTYSDILTLTLASGT